MKTLANAPLAHPTFDWAHCTNHRTGDICLRFTAGKFSDVCVSTNIGLMIADSTTDGSGDIKTAVGLIETNHIGFSVCLSIAELLLKEFDFFDYVYSRKLIGIRSLLHLL